MFPLGLSYSSKYLLGSKGKIGIQFCFSECWDDDMFVILGCLCFFDDNSIGISIMMIKSDVFIGTIILL